MSQQLQISTGWKTFGCGLKGLLHELYVKGEFNPNYGQLIAL